MSRTRFKQVVTVVSFVSFFGSTGYGVIAALKDALNRPSEKAKATTQEVQLQAQERGYQMIITARAK